MSRFAQKVIVITGGTSGIGLATAQAFAREGASVYITGRRQEALDKALEQLEGDVIGIQGDTSSLADLDRLYDTVQQRHAQIDVLFANAGGGGFAPLGAITEDHFETIFDTNVKGVLFTVQKALPVLRDGASIILTSSTTGTAGTPAFSVYSASKAAVRNFARSWILDLKDRGIRVNALSPGLTETAGLDELFGGGASSKAAKEAFVANVPSGRIGRPEETANAVLFLASDEASYINGSEIFVDGGLNQV